MASYATPEMQDMFNRWLGLVGEQVLREAGESSQKGECDVSAIARSIGVSESTVFSLLGFLHRSGRIRVETVRFSSGDGKNLEACPCLAE
jgi:predicted transcriptional regulator